MRTSKSICGREYFSITERVAFIDAYHRVSRVEGDKATQIAHIEIYDAKGGVVLANQIFSGLPVGLSGGNNIAQAYEALKLLPEFQGATDA